MIEIIKILLLVIGALFAYFRFFREGTHKQRIDFDIEYQDLGTTNKDRIIEIMVIVENKGFVEQSFEDIRITVKGLTIEKNSNKIEYLTEHPHRLKFTKEIGNLKKCSLIPDEWSPFFVRPKVLQRFPLVTAIPKEWTLIWIRATFKYKGTKNIHSSERVFISQGKNSICNEQVILTITGQRPD